MHGAASFTNIFQCLVVPSRIHYKHALPLPPQFSVFRCSEYIHYSDARRCRVLHG